ncbi:plasmid mobilization protein [Ruminococcus sp. XPD3002]|uniref:plasmid mobilization protein n=1 Tax=Ruminococcus sp. XPD3002 TaxID=1452269 RepID=UPI0009205302|nr:mobilisation protein (MobC) [Ruminococcus flavefaciens]
MRKYKQVKEKKVTFDMNEWAEVERRAAAAGLKTGTYIKKIAVKGEFTYYDMKNVAPLVNGMRTISNNINQIARKANETHSIYAGDIETLRGGFEELCRMLNVFLSDLPSTKV